MIGIIAIIICIWMFIFYNERRYKRDMDVLKEVLRDMDDRLIVLETWAGDAPEISAAMESDDNGG